MLEKKQKSFLVPASLLIALVYAICFYRNNLCICKTLRIFIEGRVRNCNFSSELFAKRRN